MPWRDDPSPYRVMVSELMLQQTQVSRVIPKFQLFIARFPDVSVLASASLADVLDAWSGLGYNRRAKYLHLTAHTIVADHAGSIPQTLDELVRLPGIGPNTAGAIMAYAYNQPTIFVETNIRTVYLHHFFSDATDQVTDAQLRPVIAETLDRRRPREWYWAVMDYGSHLKQTVGGRLDRVAGHRRQSQLRGSLREMRGRIIRQLRAGPLSDEMLRQQVVADRRYRRALAALIQEGFVDSIDDGWCLTGYNKAP